MPSQRQSILALVAAGRISAAEAERLLRAWNEPVQWLLAAVLGLVLLLQHPQLHTLAPVHGLHWLLQRGLDLWHTAARLLITGKVGTV